MAAKKKEEVVEEPRMRMGSDLLDLLVGGDKGVYGLPYGVILNIIGDRQSGKSFDKNEILACNYWLLQDKLEYFSDDCESGDTFDTKRLYGIDLHPEIRRIGTKVVEDSATVEEMDAKVSLFLNAKKKDTFGIYAIDSLDGLADSNRITKESKRVGQLTSGNDVQDDGDYGAQIAKFLSQDFFRVKHKKLEDSKVSLIIVSQIRDKMNASTYGVKWQVSCGKALEFYSHTRIFLKTICPIKKGDRVVGAYVEASTVKSKTPRPYRQVCYSVYFDYGIDNIGSNIDYLFDLRDEKGKLLKVASAIIWSENAKPKSLDNLQEWLEANGYTAACRDDKKEKQGNNRLSVEWILEWVGKDPDIKAKFDDCFGQEYTRDELIHMCEEDKGMCDELTRRVRDKWEALEDAVATKRPSKYGR